MCHGKNIANAIIQIRKAREHLKEDYIGSVSKSISTVNKILTKFIEEHDMETPRSLEKCPFCGEQPCVVVWDDQSRETVIEGAIQEENYDFKSGNFINAAIKILQKAQIQCECGIRGPEQSGENAIQEVIAIWNTRNTSIC